MSVHEHRRYTSFAAASTGSRHTHWRPCKQQRGRFWRARSYGYRAPEGGNVCSCTVGSGPLWSAQRWLSGPVVHWPEPAGLPGSPRAWLAIRITGRTAAVHLGSCMVLGTAGALWAPTAAVRLGGLNIPLPLILWSAVILAPPVPHAPDRAPERGRDTTPS